MTAYDLLEIIEAFAARYRSPSKAAIAGSVLISFLNGECKHLCDARRSVCELCGEDFRATS